MTPTIRPMHDTDLPAARALVASVHWNQTERDLRLFLDPPENIYLVAEVEGRVVGTVAAIRYGPDLAWISMMIVAEAWRGRGISRQLLQTVIQQLKDRGCRTLKLDATPAGRPVYRKLGFVEAYVIHRLAHPGEMPIVTPMQSDVRRMEQEDLPAVLRLDKSIFGAERPGLIRRLAAENFSYVLEENGQPTAYLLGRAGRRYDQFGPLGAGNFAQARTLLAAALGDRSGGAVALDMLADKKELEDWLKSLGFAFERPFYRMYLGERMDAEDVDRHFLVAGPEFG